MVKIGLFSGQNHHIPTEATRLAIVHEVNSVVEQDKGDVLRRKTF